jgi:sugar lactone lactonase YvrE
MAADSAGNLYFADGPNNRVRRISADGIITTVAGTGQRVSSGDGGLAFNASLSLPDNLTLDVLGNLFIGEFATGRVRQITPDGLIATVVGIEPSDSDGVAATSIRVSATDTATDPQGNLYIADAGSNRIRKVTPDGAIHTVAGTGTAGFSGDGGPALAAEFRFPNGITLDSAGNIYVADSGNSRVRKIATDGMVTTIAGTGSPGISGDGGLATNAQVGNFLCGIAVDGSGSVYVADCSGHVNGGFIRPNILCSATVALPACSGHRIRRITADGVITTFAGNGTFGFSGDGGPAAAAQLNLTPDLVDRAYLPSAIAVDTSDNLYIADVSNGRIRKVDKDGVITTVQYRVPPGANQDQLGSPHSVAVDSRGNLYVADPYSNRIRKIATDGIFTTVAGTGQYGFPADGALALDAPLNEPFDVSVDPTGNLYLIDNNRRIFKVTTNSVTGEVQVTVQTAPAGLQITVDGTNYVAPKLFSWTTGSSHTIATTTPQGGGETRNVFANWSDGGAISHTVSATVSTTYTANFTTQYLLTAGVSPSGSGTIGANPSSTDGYYNSGTSVQLSALANPGYAFLNWSGDVTGSANPVPVTMSGPRNVTGDFGIATAPRFVTDFNGDGKTDLLWQNDGTGQIGTWFMDGTTAITGTFFNPGQVDDTAWKIVGTADFNGDSAADLVWQHAATGDIGVWFMNGINLMSATLFTPSPVPDTNWKIVTIGDFNADGKPDLVWQRDGTGEVGVWFMNGASLISGLLFDPDQTLGTNWKIVGTGDFNGDGKPDLVWQHLVTSDIKVWWMNKVTRLAEVSFNPSYVLDTDWKVVGIADFNDDGHPDLIWQHALNGLVGVWLMDGTNQIAGQLFNPSQAADLQWKIRNR